MSRFDLFFVILDECEETSDYHIADYILRTHQNTQGPSRTNFSQVVGNIGHSTDFNNSI